MKLRRTKGGGGSYTVTLPMGSVLALRWKEGDVLEVNRDGRKLVISKVGDG